jgi:hypothetical protein
MKAKPWVAPAMKNILGARPIVSLAMMAAISTAQVIISIRANVPKIALGVPFIPPAYCRDNEKIAASEALSLPIEVALVLVRVAGSPGAVKSVWVSGVG